MLMNIILNLAFIRRWRRGPGAPRTTRPPAHARARRFSAIASTLLATVAVLTACSSNPDDTASAGAADNPVRVVASTNVYGNIAAQIGGDRVHVTSIIDDPNQDPHSYEASPQNQLALSRARVIIENGGGYDDFMDVMRHTAARADAVVLDAVEISGRSDASPGLNEHVWYDFPSMGKLAAKLADAFTQVDPGSAATFRANAAVFATRLEALERTEAAIRAKHAGVSVAVTEPVPLYLLAACGLVNRTPDPFSQAVEDGTDVSPRVLNQTLALVDGRHVALLAYNEQAASAETEKLLAAARQHNVAVVPVTETLPTGQDYLSWMAGNVAAVESALRS
jgi:zinc/manganese transport system substrate-binding protein